MNVIDTRQQLNGNWWCNGTIDGYDESFSAQSISAAQSKMKEYLRTMNIPENECRWTDPKFYTESEKISDYQIKAQTTRLDHKPFA